MEKKGGGGGGGQEKQNKMAHRQIRKPFYSVDLKLPETSDHIFKSTIINLDNWNPSGQISLYRVICWCSKDAKPTTKTDHQIDNLLIS